MHVIGCDELYVIFPRYSYQFGVHLLLHLIHCAVGAGLVGRVALKLNVIVFAKHAFEPLHLSFGFLNLSGLDETWYLAAETINPSLWEASAALSVRGWE